MSFQYILTIQHRHSFPIFGWCTA